MLYRVINNMTLRIITSSGGGRSERRKVRARCGGGRHCDVTLDAERYLVFDKVFLHTLPVDTKLHCTGGGM